MVQGWKFGFVVPEFFVGSGKQDLTLGNVLRCNRPTLSSIDEGKPSYDL